MSKNPLLEDLIQKGVQEARYKEPKPSNSQTSIFYLVVISLVTLVILFSLFRYF